MSLPEKISATLLLARPARLDLDDVRRAAEARLASENAGFVETVWRHTPLLSSRSMHLRVQPRDLPVPDGRLDIALDSGLAQLLRENPPDAVARHRAAIVLTAGLGPKPTPGITGGGATHEAYDRLLILAHVAATRLGRDNDLLAVHWGPSEQILSAARFSVLSDMTFPLPLFLHALPDRREIDGMTWTALELRGAEGLIGYRLRTAPSPVDYGWIMPRVYAFVTHVRAQGRPLPHGAVFATQDGERLRVLHTPDGALCLAPEERRGRPLPQIDPEAFATAA